MTLARGFMKLAIRSIGNLAGKIVVLDYCNSGGYYI